MGTTNKGACPSNIFDIRGRERKFLFGVENEENGLSIHTHRRELPTRTRHVQVSPPVSGSGAPFGSFSVELIERKSLDKY